MESDKFEEQFQLLKNEYELYKSQNSKEMISTLIAERDKLQTFKDYVHNRLDLMNIEKNPEGLHSADGCRIGDRMDIVVMFIAEHRLMKQFIEDVKDGLYGHPHIGAEETLKQITL